MIAGGFSVYGFDLFGLTRRADDGDLCCNVVPKISAKKTERTVREDALVRRHRSESFFWRLHPFY